MALLDDKTKQLLQDYIGLQQLQSKQKKPLGPIRFGGTPVEAPSEPGFPQTFAPTIQRGLSAVTRTIGKGISTWGKWVGGAAEWALSPIMDDLIESKFGVVAAEEYRGARRQAAERYNTIKGEQGFLAALDDHLYEWNEVREGRTSIFPGEKFVTEIMFDPTTYMGFGLATKVPVLGKLGLGFVMDAAPKWAGNLVGKTAAGAIRRFSVGVATPLAGKFGGLLFSPSIKSQATARGKEAATAVKRLLGQAVSGDPSDAVVSEILTRNLPADAERFRSAIIEAAHAGHGLNGAEDVLKAVTVEHILKSGRGEDLFKEALAAAELGKLPLGQRGGLKAMSVDQLLLDGMTPQEMVNKIESLSSLYTSSALGDAWQAYMKGKDAVISTLANTAEVKGMARFAAQFARYAITEPARALLVFSSYGVMNTMEDGIRAALGGHFPKGMVGDDLDLIRGAFNDYSIIRGGEQLNWEARQAIAEKSIPFYLQPLGPVAKRMIAMNSWFQDIGANVRRGFAAKEFRVQLRKIATEKQLLSGTKDIRTSVDAALDIMKRHYPRAFKSHELGRVGDIAEYYILEGRINDLPTLSRVVLEGRLSGLKEAMTQMPAVPFGVRASLEAEIKANGFALADPARFEAMKKVVYATLYENARVQPELVLEQFDNTLGQMEKLLRESDIPVSAKEPWQMTPQERKAESWVEVWRQDRADVPATPGFREGAHWGTKEQAEAIAKREHEAGRPLGKLRHGFIKVQKPFETSDAGFWEKPIKEAREGGHDVVVYPNEGEQVGGLSYIPLSPEQLREVPAEGMAETAASTLNDATVVSFLKSLTHGQEQLNAQQQALIKWNVPSIFNKDEKTRDLMWEQLGETRKRVAEKQAQVVERLGKVIDTIADKAHALGTVNSLVAEKTLRRLKSVGGDIIKQQKGYVEFATDLDHKWFTPGLGGRTREEWKVLESRLVGGDLTALAEGPQAWRTALERGAPVVETGGKFLSQGVYLTVRGLRQYMPIEDALKLSKNNKAYQDELMNQMYLIRQHSLHEAKTAYFADDTIPAKFLSLFEEIGAAEADTALIPQFAARVEGDQHILEGMDIFRNWQNQVDLAMDDLQKRVTTPQPDVSAIESWLNEMADEMRRLPPDQLKLLQEGARTAWDETEKVVKKNFTNYDNPMVVDDLMRNIFPFWQYQSRSLPWLLGASAAHPLVAANLWSQGRYWKYTEDGYLPTHIADMQIMPLRGTVFARMRRMWRGEYPPSVTGIGGYVESMSGLAERLGFFPGVGVEAALQATTSLAGGGELEEVLSPIMEGMPPIMSSAVDGLIAASRVSPGFTITLAEKLLPSKYRSYYAEKMLWENRRVTVQQAKEQGHEDWIAQAYSDVAIRQMVEEQLSLTRLQPESWQKIYEDLGKLMAEELGMTHEEYEEKRLQARAEGKRLTEILPMSRIERSKMSVVEGIDAIASAGLVLSPEGRRRYLTARADYYDTLNTMREDNRQLQLVEDAALLAEEITPTMWLDNQSDRTRNYRSFAENALQSTYFGQIGVTKEEQDALATKFRLVSLETHPIDAALDDLYSIEPQADPYNDGELDWGSWRQAQEALIASLPSEDAAKVKEYLQRNLTPLQKEYREGLSAASAWFDYERGIVEFYRSMGNDQRADYMHDVFLRRGAAEKAKEVSMFRMESARREILELNRLNRIIRREQSRYRQMVLASDPKIGPFLRKFFSVQSVPLTS